jgi:hypothetical protein
VKDISNSETQLVDRTRLESGWASFNEEEIAWLLDYQKHIRVIISRAMATYLVLFLCLGLVMSFSGVSPLAKNGLMPKVLLIFVGLALLLALANTLSENFSEYRQGWSTLLRRQLPLSIFARRD